jgi:mRNA interferase RelE/StbE
VKRAQVLLLEEAEDDLRKLDGSARRIVLSGLKKLQSDPHLRGAALGSRSLADLTGLRKLVVGDRIYRIVYEVRADGTVVIVWVIAKRADAEAYRVARDRLERYQGDASRKAALQAILDAAFGPRPA